MRRSKPAGAWRLSIRTGAAPVVAEPVLDAGRHEHERPRWGGHLLRAEAERHLALEDVERVVLVGVDVRLELATGRDLDDPEVEARRVARAGENSTLPTRWP